MCGHVVNAAAKAHLEQQQLSAEQLAEREAGVLRWLERYAQKQAVAMGLQVRGGAAHKFAAMLQRTCLRAASGLAAAV